VSTQLAVAEWHRAQRALRAAETLLESGLFADSVSRAYYATFHAARAALALRGALPSTHRGLRRTFGYELVNTGALEPEWARILAQLQDRREDADYDVSAEMSAELAAEIVNQARRFLHRMAGYLRSEGLDGRFINTD
jgi:uncharacterized protein (UPF0332 family)